MPERRMKRNSAWPTKQLLNQMFREEDRLEHHVDRRQLGAVSDQGRDQRHRGVQQAVLLDVGEDGGDHGAPIPSRRPARRRNVPQSTTGVRHSARRSEDLFDFTPVSSWRSGFVCGRRR